MLCFVHAQMEWHSHKSDSALVHTCRPEVSAGISTHWVPLFFFLGSWLSSSPPPLAYSTDHQSLTDKSSVIYWTSEQCHCATTVACVNSVFLLVTGIGVCITWNQFPFYSWLGLVNKYASLMGDTTSSDMDEKVLGTRSGFIEIKMFQLIVFHNILREINSHFTGKNNGQ